MLWWRGRLWPRVAGAKVELAGTEARATKAQAVPPD